MQVRFFAAAADAAGASQVSLTQGEVTVAALLAQLGADNPKLAAVLPQCSVLVGGVRVSDEDVLVPAGAQVDVLPPFAGG